MRFYRHESRPKRRVEHRGFAPLVRGYARMYVRTYAHTLRQFVFFCCHKCHTFAAKRIVKIRLSVDCRLLFLSLGKQRVVSSKHRVVFFKTSCCFSQNIVLFSSKHRVVL